MPILLGRSNETGKKVKRGYFKDESILLTCKCIFSTNEAVEIRAKLYVSAQKLHLVHLPKRRELTSIPFEMVSSMQGSTFPPQLHVVVFDGSIFNLEIYGPPSSLDFIVSCWNAASKDKTANQQGDSNTTSSSTSSSTSSFSLLPSGNTSLSGFNTQETKSPVQTADGFPEGAEGAGREDPLVPVESALGLGSAPETVSMTSKLTASEVNVSGAGSAAAPVPTDHPALIRQPKSHQTKQPEAGKTTPRKKGIGERRAQPTAAPVEERDAVDCKLAAQRNPLVPHPGVGSAASPRPSSSVLFWPVNWLLYFLVSLKAVQRHQRLTMLIAYVILAFLLCSTLHLYHRLALFHFGPSSSLVFPSSSQPSASKEPLDNVAPEEELKVIRQRLELATVHLVQLTDQMNQLVAQFTREMQRFGSASEVTEETVSDADQQQPQSTLV